MTGIKMCMLHWIFAHNRLAHEIIDCFFKTTYTHHYYPWPWTEGTKNKLPSPIYRHCRLKCTFNDFRVSVFCMWIWIFCIEHSSPQWCCLNAPRLDDFLSSDVTDTCKICIQRSGWGGSNFQWHSFKDIF